jgi:beta-glucanase (GH16 family)
MRRPNVAVVVAALILALTACNDGESGDNPRDQRKGWTEVWSDGFDGAANSRLSAKDWIYSVGTGYRGGAAQWGTGEIQTMTDNVANVHHDGEGHLAIVPLRNPAGQWTSGRVETRRTDFAAPAGGAVRIEATLQMPNISGAQAAGYWAAFWALGAPARPAGASNWPVIGEWDIMENVNGHDSVWQTLHCGVPVGGPCKEPSGISSGELPCPGCRTALHTYALEYDRSTNPEQLRWYVDDKNTFTLRADQVEKTVWTAANQHGFFVILNVAIGGAFPAPYGGGPTGATRPGVPMLVDRVAVSIR